MLKCFTNYNYENKSKQNKIIIRNFLHKFFIQNFIFLLDYKYLYLILYTENLEQQILVLMRFQLLFFSRSFLVIKLFFKDFNVTQNLFFPLFTAFYLLTGFPKVLNVIKKIILKYNYCILRVLLIIEYFEEETNCEITKATTIKKYTY